MDQPNPSSWDTQEEVICELEKRIVQDGCFSSAMEKGGFLSEYSTLCHLLSLRKEKIGTRDRTAQYTAFLHLSWDLLHLRHWKDTEECVRHCYAIASLLVADSFIEQKKFKESLRQLDLGLLMGGDLFSDLIQKVITRLQPQFQKEKISKKQNQSLRQDFSLPSTQPSPGNLQTNLMQEIRLKTKVQPIPVRERLSVEAFLHDYLEKNQPVILRGCLDDWEALHKWKDMDHFRKIAGSRTIPVEIGPNYLSPMWRQTLMTMNEFLDQYIVRENDEIGYLAQTQLLDQIPQLANEIDRPIYSYLHNEKDIYRINFWFGPKGTVSPCHHDPYNNLLAQVIGKKKIQLYETKDSEKLYPHPQLLCNTSQVDVEKPDLSKFPKFDQIEYSWECELIAGDMLFIPKLMWHHVRSLSPSISLSFWWG